MQKIALTAISFFKIEIGKSRIFGLDVLRALAILFVMIGHGADLLSVEHKATIFLLLPDGVSIFFVLSGFLIGGILIKVLEKESLSYNDLFIFWQRRWLRTLPMYYAVLIILLLLSFTSTSHSVIKESLPFFVFCQNLIKWDSSFFTVSWSLTIEEWFYLITPCSLIFSVVICRLKPYNAILLSATFIILFSVGCRFYRFTSFVVDNPTIFDNWFRRPVITRLDSLMFGVVAANFRHYKTPLWYAGRIQFFLTGIFLHIAIKISTALFLFKSAFYYCNVSFVFESIATALLLPYLSLLLKGKSFLYWPITYISLISYSMYLLHAQVVLNWILPWIRTVGRGHLSSVIFNYFSYWIVTIVVSILTYKHIEVFFLKLRRK